MVGKRREDQNSDFDNNEYTTLEKKPKLKSRYERKIPTKLLEDSRFASWIDKSKRNENKAMCKVCNSEIAGGVTQLERHGRTEKHLKNVNSRKQISKVIDFRHAHPSSLQKSPNGEMELEESIADNADDFNQPTIVIQKSDTPIMGESLGGEEVEANEFIIHAPHDITMDSLISSKKKRMESKNDVKSSSTIASDCKYVTEFDVFGNSVAAQLNNMPVVEAIEVQLKIQELITHHRLKIYAMANNERTMR